MNSASNINGICHDRCDELHQQQCFDKEFVTWTHKTFCWSMLSFSNYSFCMLLRKFKTNIQKCRYIFIYNVIVLIPFHTLSRVFLYTTKILTQHLLSLKKTSKVLTVCSYSSLRMDKDSVVRVGPFFRQQCFDIKMTVWTLQSLVVSCCCSFKPSLVQSTNFLKTVYDTCKCNIFHSFLNLMR